MNDVAAVVEACENIRLWMNHFVLRLNWSRADVESMTLDQLFYWAEQVNETNKNS